MEATRDYTSTTFTTGCSNFDVFLNFRGEDTRNNFVGFLCLFMKVKGIHVFLDSEKLSTEEAIGPACLGAIAPSKISIPVFSQRYANSKWCLLELAQIHQCHISNGQLVLPIFFNVDPSHVRKQTESLEEAFQEHEKHFGPQTVDSWRKALTAIGSLKGEVIDENKNQAEIVELVVKRVSDVLVSSTYLAECKYPIGMNPGVQDLSSLLSTDSQDVQFIGICGPCGIGKTTIAKAVYNCIHSRFKRQSFISDVNKQAMECNGLVYLQKRVLKDIFRTDFDIVDLHRGKTMIEQRLCKENVLLVLDGVDSKEQLDALAGEASWFGQGSRVIITTTEDHILNVAKVDKGKIYLLKELNHEESLQLFSLHAFSTIEPPEEYMQLSHNVVSYSRGLPSTLEVLGCYFSDIRNREEWKITLQKLKAGKASIYRLPSLRRQRSIHPMEENPLGCQPLFQRTIGTVVTQVFTRCLEPNGSPALERIREGFTTEKQQNETVRSRVQYEDESQCLVPNGSPAIKRIHEGLTTEEQQNESVTSRVNNEDESCNKPIRFTLREIKAATKTFDESRRIGEGGFCAVYKGFLKKDSMWIATKVANRWQQQSREEFLKELNISSKLRHKHLVSLIGFCDENDEMILVYEYMIKGSLFQYLYQSKYKDSPLQQLTWKERLEICIGVARGLHYLHMGSPAMKVIHRDIKTDNILLDDKFMAKIADFGISIIPEGPDHKSNNDGLKGTPGYIDPEYVETGTLTDKSDVYSFGVVLLEVVRGQRPFVSGTCSYFLPNSEFARVVLLPFTVDVWLAGKHSPESMEIFKEIAEKCIRKEGKHRPTMAEVLSDLERALKLHEDWLKLR